MPGQLGAGQAGREGTANLVRPGATRSDEEGPDLLGPGVPLPTTAASLTPGRPSSASSTSGVSTLLPATLMILPHLDSTTTRPAASTRPMSSVANQPPRKRSRVQARLPAVARRQAGAADLEQAGPARSHRLPALGVNRGHGDAGQGGPAHSAVPARSRLTMPVSVVP